MRDHSFQLDDKTRDDIIDGLSEDPLLATQERFQGDFRDPPGEMDPLARATLAGARRKAQGFRVTRNPKNPPAPWNELAVPMVLILSPRVRAKLGLLKRAQRAKKGRKAAR